MKLSKIEQVNEFLAIVDSCKGEGSAFVIIVYYL